MANLIKTVCDCSLQVIIVGANASVVAIFDEGILVINHSVTLQSPNSNLQDTVKVPVQIHNGGLYRIMIRYVNRDVQGAEGNVTLIPVQVDQDGKICCTLWDVGIHTFVTQ